jgi:hypothetical protein
MIGPEPRAYRLFDGAHVQTARGLVLAHPGHAQPCGKGRLLTPGSLGQTRTLAERKFGCACAAPRCRCGQGAPGDLGK